jgi:PTS system trehalose-specific IIC component
MPGSNHAVGMRIANGAEILLHIGLDTVGMNGDGFTCHVREGQLVRKGDRLITFDTAKIKAAGHPLVTMMVVTEDNGNENLAFENGKAVTAGDTKIATIG